MKKLVVTAAFLFCSAYAQPSYFSSSGVRDHIAQRTGAYEVSCLEVMNIVGADAPYSNCLFLKGSGGYVKSIIDIYYRDYFSGGWKFYGDSAIYNFIRKDGQSLEIKIIEKNGVTVVSVYDLQMRSKIAAVQAERKDSELAGAAGATPGAGYVRLADLRDFATVTAQGKNYSAAVGSQKIEFTLGSRAAKLNGKPATLNATPFLLSGSAYFPLAAVKMLGCTLGNPEQGMAMLGCPSKTSYIEFKTFTTRNAAAGPLQYMASQVQASAVSAVASRDQAVPQSSNVPAGAVRGIPYVTVESLTFLGTMGYLSDGSAELIAGGKTVTYRPGQRTTREGGVMEAVPFYFNAERLLVVPLSSVKLLGCSFTTDTTSFTVDCPSGSSADGVVLRW